MKKTQYLTAICLFYNGFIWLWFGLWLFSGEHFWWMMVLNRISPYLFLPVSILVLITALARRPKLVLLSLLPLLIFGWLYWPYITPRFVTDFESPDFRVMTFNGLFSNQDCDSVADIILSHLPDMVALQEVQPEMMAALQTRLGETYPNSLLGFENDYGTTAVFSRHPFIEQTIVDLLADRPATIVTVMVDGKKITFAAVHLLAYGLQWYTPPEIPDVIKQRTQDQNRQADLLLATLENHDGVAIIACDCNSKETSSSYRILNQHMRNAAGEVGRQIKRWKPGTSPDINLQHIDYVFYRGDLTPTTVYLVEDGGGSDHKPVVTDFKLGG